MGTEISWIAVKGLSSDEVMNALDFEPAPDGERRPKASLRDMGDGWTVVLTSHFGFPTPDRMKALSRGGSRHRLFRRRSSDVQRRQRLQRR